MRKGGVLHLIGTIKNIWRGFNCLNDGRMEHKLMPAHPHVMAPYLWISRYSDRRKLVYNVLLNFLHIMYSCDS